MNIDNMNEEKKITIAILNYNGLRYLKKTIPILLFFNYSNYEIVIVDNNSTDGSVDFIKSLSNERIVLIENDYNFGYSKGKNICVANSRGEYILLLDNDIFIPEHNILNDLLKKYSLLENPAFLSVVLLDNGSTVSKYYGIYYSFYGINVHKKTKKIVDIVFSKNTEKNILIGSFNGGAVFFKKNIWNELGGYDELQPFMLDDFDIGIRAYIFGYNNYLFNNYALIHIGKEKDLDKKHFAWKFKYYFSGVITTVWKNYKLINLVFFIFIYFFYSIILLFSLVIKKNNYYLFGSYVKSIILFLKNFHYIYIQRKKIQNIRIIKKDIFLKIKPPKFN